MTAELILNKAVELIKAFFIYTMTVGESNILITDSTWMDYVSDNFFLMIAPFLISATILALGSDSFLLFHPIDEISEWFKKISILKVTIFSAAIFSLHTFYKMFVSAIAVLAKDNIGDVMTNCLGNFINPISVLILSIAICTTKLKRRGFQAVFLGAAVFVTPSVLSYYTLTVEHIVIFSVGIALSIITGILYDRVSMYVTYAIMSFAYLVGKFFLIYFSDQAIIIDSHTIFGQLCQYITCMRIDIGMIIVLLCVLFIYRAVAEPITGKSIIAYFVVLVLYIALFISTYLTRNLYPINPVIYPRVFNNPFWDKEEDTAEAEPVNEEVVEEPSYVEVDAEFVNAYASSYLTSSSGVAYDIDNTFDDVPETCWQEGVRGDGIGEYLTYEFDDILLSRITVTNGNRRDETSYERNNRLATATVYFYEGDTEVYKEDIEFEDDENAISEFVFDEGVQCNKVVIEITDVYHGSKYKDTCVAEVQFSKLIEEQ